MISILHDLSLCFVIGMVVVVHKIATAVQLSHWLLQHWLLLLLLRLCKRRYDSCSQKERQESRYIDLILKGAWKGAEYIVKVIEHRSSSDATLPRVFFCSLHNGLTGEGVNDGAMSNSTCHCHNWIEVLACNLSGRVDALGTYAFKVRKLTLLQDAQMGRVIRKRSW